MSETKFEACNEHTNCAVRVTTTTQTTHRVHKPAPILSPTTFTGNLNSAAWAAAQEYVDLLCTSDGAVRDTVGKLQAIIVRHVGPTVEAANLRTEYLTLKDEHHRLKGEYEKTQAALKMAGDISHDINAAANTLRTIARSV